MKPPKRGKEDDKKVADVQPIGEGRSEDGAAMSAASEMSQQSATMRDGANTADPPDKSWQDKLSSIMQGQKSIIDKINSNHREMKDMISREIKKVRDDVFLEIAQVTQRLEAIETRASAAPPSREPFAPDQTVVIANLPMLSPNETEAQLLEKVDHIIGTGLELPGIETVAATRRPGRGSTPGLVLVELNSLDDKKMILRAKMSLREKPQFRNLFIRSAEGHTDRLIRLNFQTLLQHFDLTQRFRLTGSGRLVPRERPAGNGMPHDRTQSPRRPESVATPGQPQSADQGIQGSRVPGTNDDGNLGEE